MFRYGAARSLKARLAAPAGRVGTTPSISATAFRSLSFKNAAASRSIQPHRPATLALVRFQSTSRRETKIDDKLEALQPHPETVSTTSSVQSASIDQLTSRTKEEEDVDMMAGIRGDMKTITATFSLQHVPTDALRFGLAGVIPYLATSVSTLGLSYDLNHSMILDVQTSEMLLHLLQTLQVGYGAVIISFLGAIHLGFEWAGYNGSHALMRYRTAFLAPAIAWPTLLLPYESSLIVQFLAFNWLYLNDANASTRGQMPEWVGIYRFVLTFIVGASIVASLVASGQMVEFEGEPNSVLHKVQQWKDQRELLLAEEEEAREQAMAEEDEDED